MSNNTYNASKPRYSIDLSRDKYPSRYDRLLNILFYAKELPNNYYGKTNLSYDNFRKTVSILKQRGLLTRISKDGTAGYILTSKGKQLVNQPHYMKYRDCLEDDRRQYDIVRRKRRRQFANLYALMDRVGVPFESFMKPDLKEVSVQDEKVYFYTALEIKRLLGIGSNPFKGSRLLGFLIGRGKAIAVYRTDHMLESFGRHEAIIPDLLMMCFPVRIDTAIMICNCDYSAINILNQIIESNSYDKAGVNTARYKYFYVLPGNDTFFSRLEDLYADHSATEQKLIERYRINTSDRDGTGRYRLKTATGFMGDSPVWICAGNVNAVTLKHFILGSEYHNSRSVIFCRKRDRFVLDEITKDRPIKVSPIRDEFD